MIRPGPGAMRVIRIFFAIMMAVSSVVAIKRFYPARRTAPAPAADTLAAADDRDGDGLSDPLPVRRLAASPAGETLLAAIGAAGGWNAWALHPTVRYTMEGVFFDTRGLMGPRGTETHTLRLNGPTRIRIDPGEGRAHFGYGPAGAWVAVRRSDGRWARAEDPDAWAPRRLHELTWRPWWMFGLPFVLGDPNVRLTPAAPDSYDVAAVNAETGVSFTPAGPTDTLNWVEATYPSAASDTTDATYRLGFETATGRLREITFPAGEGGPYTGRLIVHLDSYTETGHLTLPLLRTLYEETAPGAGRRQIFTARLDRITWDVPAGDSLFDAPGVIE